jgi:SAM-dependent methyltransferase
MGRKRNSRRTVKLVDSKKSAHEAAVDGPSDGTLTPVLPEVMEADPPTTVGAQTSGFSELPDFSDAVADEITVVRALRIINVGNEPPPPIKSAQVTWPPPHDPSEIDTGWTPIAPPVADYPPPGDYSAPPYAEAPPAPAAFSPAAEPIRVPSAPDIPIITEEIAPLIELDSDRIPDERDDLIEDIEPDSLPLPDAPLHTPKKPPPPPPKARPEPKAVTELPKKGKPWWEDIFSEEYLRTHDRPDDLTVQREVNFIEESLGMEKHAVVLDLACGAGDHTIDFALRGYNVMGLDYSLGQLAIAEQRLKNRTRAITAPTVPTFVQGDMREMAYEEAFDGVYCWGTSFGYFDEEKNLAVLQNVHRSLKQGGMFLLDVVNRDYVASRAPGLVWFEGDRCVCMDDTYLDFFTSRLRVKRTAMFEGGLSRELDYSIRLYTLHELGKMLHEAGFKVIEVTGLTAHPGVFFGTESPRIIVLAERA